MPRVRQGEAGLALAAVTQAAEENRGRMEKYVRTWWVEAVSQHLVTPSEREEERVCMCPSVKPSVNSGAELSRKCVNVCLFMRQNIEEAQKRGTWRLVPCSLARCWCCCGQVHTHGHTWFHNHSSIRCFSGSSDLNQILDHWHGEKDDFVVAVCPAKTAQISD